jgi:hypothetical protein
MFFVNGPIPVNGIATFRYQSDEAFSIQFRVGYQGGGLIMVPSSTVCTTLSIPFNAMGVDFGSSTFYTVNYAVVTLAGTLTGQIPFVRPAHTAPLRFGFLSCNDSPATAHVDNPFHNSIDARLFRRMATERLDVVVHLGDCVYMDSVWERYRNRTINRIGVRDEARRLYSSSFTEPEQGRSMRQGYQLMMIDDHDYTDGAGTSITLADPTFLDYVTIVREVHMEYGLLPGVTSHTLGRYKITMCDTRNAVLDFGCRYPQSVIQDVEHALNDLEKNHLLCLPTPLVNRDMVQAWLVGLVDAGEGKDDSQHPLNRKGSREFTDMLFRARQAGCRFNLISGDVHRAMIQKYRRNTPSGTYSFSEMVTSPITRSPTAKDPILLRVLYWIEDAMSLRKFTTSLYKRTPITNNNNYGVFIQDTLEIREV